MQYASVVNNESTNIYVIKDHAKYVTLRCACVYVRERECVCARKNERESVFVCVTEDTSQTTNIISKDFLRSVDTC